jgi:alpha-L-fucosidase
LHHTGHYRRSRAGHSIGGPQRRVGWPEDGELTIKSLPAGKALASGPINEVRMLGVEEPLALFQDDHGMTVQLPERKPCNFAWVLKISAAK